MTLLVYRTGFTGIGPVLFFTAASMISMSDLVVIVMTCPAWIMFFSVILYKEKIHIYQIINTILIFIGIVFVSRPTFIFKNTVM
jgi:drug/metabolite transporter (DMT)-like permease